VIHDPLVLAPEGLNHMRYIQPGWSVSAWTSRSQGRITQTSQPGRGQSTSTEVDQGRSAANSSAGWSKLAVRTSVSARSMRLSGRAASYNCIMVPAGTTLSSASASEPITAALTVSRELREHGLARRLASDPW
jgi:hypothetical protein